MSAEEFATAVEGLITAARAKGMPIETLLVEIEDISSLLREALDSEQRPDLDRRGVEALGVSDASPAITPSVTSALAASHGRWPATGAAATGSSICTTGRTRSGTETPAPAGAGR